MPGGKRKVKDDEASVTSEGKMPVKSVQALMGEGEKFFRDQLYHKAIQCYTEVLDLSPGNKSALVERSSCYLKVGKNDLALADAEESLKENKEFTKGLYQKAEALYAMGEFELALVFFHRGKKLRGDVREFQLGINKAQEAIDNCVGDPHSVKLEVKGDLAYFEKPDEKQKKQKQGGYIKPISQKQNVQQKREKRVEKTGSQKTVQQLLGELYADKVYLEKLLEDDIVTKPNTKTGDAIYSLANNGLDFLDSRTEFWRQQKPIYARKRKEWVKSPAGSKEPLDYVLQQLETIDSLQSNGRYAESLQKCDNLMNFVHKLPEKYEQDRPRLIGNIHSNKGNAYLELGKYDLALQAHQKDRELADASGNNEDKSRALENLGRVYARNGKFQEAINVWEEKLPLATHDMEKAWLYHEIGRCYLELGNNERAREYGLLSKESAEKFENETWQLNATVLIAQSEAKMGDIDNLISAIEHFEKALEMTKKLNDAAAENAITKALSDCREKHKKLEANETVRLSDFKVEVKTGSDQGAGTDAHVFLDIHGARDQLVNLALKNSETHTNTFEAGNNDVFNLTQQKNTGRIKKISIRHDSAGIGAAWKIESILITKDNKETYFFAVDKWLERNTNDKKSTLELEPTKFTTLDAAAVSAAKYTTTAVKIAVKLEGIVEVDEKHEHECFTLEYTEEKNEEIVEYSDSLNSEQSIFSEPKVNSSESNSNTSGGRNSLSRSSSFFKRVVSLIAKTPSLSSLKRFNRSESDNGQENGGKNQTNSSKTPVDDKKSTSKTPVEDKKSLSKTPSDDRKNQSKSSKSSKDDSKSSSKTPDASKKSPSEDEKEVEYTVTTTTGGKLNSGTDSNVFIIIYGEKFATEKTQLKLKDKDTFEKETVDSFNISALNVGDIKKINISHDGIKIGSGWFLDEVNVTVKGKSYKFICDRWLDKNDGDGKTEVDLFPDTGNTQKSKATDKEADYAITVKTGNKIGAGTDSKVYIVIHGEKGQTEKKQLKVAGKDTFEKGKTDTFNITAENVGEVKKINISHDGTNPGSGWYLDQLDVSVHGKNYNFPVDRWLDKDEADGKTELELVPGVKPVVEEAKKSESNEQSKSSFSKDGETEKREQNKSPSKSPVDDKDAEYNINVTTGNKIGAGTDSKVFIVIYGDKLETEKRQLKLVDKDAFEKGKTDSFNLTLQNVGEIKKINISHDGINVGDGWYLDEVNITVKGKSYKFVCDRWLDLNEGDGKTAIDLFPK